MVIYVQPGDYWVDTCLTGVGAQSLAWSTESVLVSPGPGRTIARAGKVSSALKSNE